MTDQQFYQENLIKCLESIKAEILDSADKLDYEDRKDYIPYSQGMRTGALIVDKYLDKAKQIKEINYANKSINE